MSLSASSLEGGMGVDNGDVEILPSGRLLRLWSQCSVLGSVLTINTA